MITGKTTDHVELSASVEALITRIADEKVKQYLGLNLDNAIDDSESPNDTTMSKLQRCCINTPNGNVWVQGKTIADLCQDFYNKMTSQTAPVAAPAPVKQTTPLFSDYAAEWWKLYCSKRVQQGTAIDYSMNLHKHVIPFFKDKNIGDITTKDIQRFYDAGSNYSASTCRHWKTLLLGIFNSAIEDGIIEKNPVLSKRLTMSTKKKERQPISKECAARIQADLPKLELYDRLILAILLLTGMRRGEMVGLQWGDLDFEHKLIHINRQVSFVNNQPVVKSTKSAAGIRAVPMLPELEAILLEAKPKKVAATDFVITCCDRPVTERSFRNTWQRISKKISLPAEVTPHVLRHTFLTELQASGQVDLKTLQSIAGHSKISMTMNTYVHARTDNVQKVSETGAGLYQK